MAKKLIFDTSDEIWNHVISYKIKHNLDNNNSTVERLLKIGLGIAKSDKVFVFQEENGKIRDTTIEQITNFNKKIPTLESSLARPLIILKDKKTDAYYTECHVLANDIIKLADIDAVIDPEFQEDFRANREIQPNNPDFLIMKEDAIGGRQFSDLVSEFNISYRDNIPLKVLGGQHRIAAIKDALKSNVNRYHGVRIYFDLNKDQRVEIAKISNTNINVSTDLRDRLEEQRLDPPNKLRDWCYNIGILERGKDFGDRKTGKEFEPTVRMMRTFIINFYKGLHFEGNFDKESIVPYLPKPGIMDDEYLRIFKKIKYFINEENLTKAGKMFTKLHKNQIMRSKNVGRNTSEYKLRSFNLALISSWAYAAGLLQKHPRRLEKLYNLPDYSGDNDPLNAKAMAKSRHPRIDPQETYRGLGTRTDNKERGRLLQLFLMYSESDKKSITLEMCNAAIIQFHAYEDIKNALKAKEKAF